MMDYKTRRFFRDLTRGLKIFSAFMAKMAAAILLLIVGVFFTHYAFTTTSIDDLRFGVLAMKFMGLAFCSISAGVMFIAVRDFDEDGRFYFGGR